MTEISPDSFPRSHENRPESFKMGGLGDFYPSGWTPSMDCSAWEYRLRRSASDQHGNHADAERPGRHSHAERGNE